MSTEPQLSIRHHNALAGYPSFGLHSLHQGVQRPLLESLQKSVSGARKVLLQNPTPRCALTGASSVFSRGPVRAPRFEIPFPKQTTRHRPAVALLSSPGASVLRDAHGTPVIVGLFLVLSLRALCQVSSLPRESRSRVGVCHRPLLVSVELTRVSAPLTVPLSFTSSASIPPVALGDHTASPESPYKTWASRLEHTIT